MAVNSAQQNAAALQRGRNQNKFNKRVKCEGIGLEPKGILPNTFSPSKFIVNCTNACKSFVLFCFVFRALSENSLKAIQEGTFENLLLLSKL